MEYKTRGIIRIILFIVFFPIALLIWGIASVTAEGAFFSSPSSKRKKH